MTAERHVTLCTTCGDAATGARDAQGRPACHKHAAPGELIHFAEQGRSQRADHSPERNVVGVGPDGKRPEGAADWHWRPPQHAPDEHHDQPIVLRNPNGHEGPGNHETLMFQQAPPVHVKGVAPGSAKDVRRYLHVIGETEAERLYLGAALEKAPRAEVAKVLGMTSRQLRRRIEKRNKGRKGR